MTNKRYCRHSREGGNPYGLNRTRMRGSVSVQPNFEIPFRLGDRGVVPHNDIPRRSSSSGIDGTMHWETSLSDRAGATKATNISVVIRLRIGSSPPNDEIKPRCFAASALNDWLAVTSPLPIAGLPPPSPLRPGRENGGSPPKSRANSCKYIRRRARRHLATSVRLISPGCLIEPDLLDVLIQVFVQRIDQRSRQFIV